MSCKTVRVLCGGYAAKCLKKLGGRTRARTWDPMIKSHLLYQLSYAPGTGPESLRKRASFSKAIWRCPANRRGFPGPRHRRYISKSRRNPAAFLKFLSCERKAASRAFSGEWIPVRVKKTPQNRA